MFHRRMQSNNESKQNKSPTQTHLMISFSFFLFINGSSLFPHPRFFFVKTPSKHFRFQECMYVFSFFRFFFIVVLVVLVVVDVVVVATTI